MDLEKEILENQAAETQKQIDEIKQGAHTDLNTIIALTMTRDNDKSFYEMLDNLGIAYDKDMSVDHIFNRLIFTLLLDLQKQQIKTNIALANLENYLSIVNDDMKRLEERNKKNKEIC